MRSHNDLALSLEEPGHISLRRSYLRASVGAGAGARQRRWQRHDVLCVLGKAAEGIEGVIIDMADLLAAAGLPPGQVYNALDRLEQEGAVRTFNGNCVTLLPRGLELYERAASKPYRTVSDLGHLVARGRPGLAATVPVDDCLEEDFDNKEQRSGDASVTTTDETGAPL